MLPNSLCSSLILFLLALRYHSMAEAIQIHDDSRFSQNVHHDCTGVDRHDRHCFDIEQVRILECY